eukprot:SAG25_NODE_8233_length_432_cov_1.027027_1_plen_31_part_01
MVSDCFYCDCEPYFDVAKTLEPVSAKHKDRS